MFDLPQTGAMIVLSGPSGSGKSSICKKVFSVIDDYYFSISTTTRNIRDGETNGVDYFFVSKEEFISDVESGYFLEWAEVHGNYYGTSIKPVIEALQDDKIVILDIDVQGFLLLKEKLNSEFKSVFITTPSFGELKDRLINRNTDSLETIEKRLINAKQEMQYIQQYDYFIVNDDLDIATDKLLSVIRLAKSMNSRIDVDQFIKNW
jgi:guanylate kinase